MNAPLRQTRSTLLFCRLLCLFTVLSCGAEPVRTGLDRIEEYRHLFENKRIGIVTNHTAYSRDGRHIIDILTDFDGVAIAALFGPEHGIRGDYGTDETVYREKNPIDGIPLYNLYGSKLKPTPEMLKTVELLLFDIQSVGARYYTYIYTMAKCMEAAAEKGIPFVVLDRPNPINGITLEGNLLRKEFATDVGLYPIPVRHGMTLAELAEMINEKGWLSNGHRAELTVIPMQNWQRHMWYDDTGLDWIPPSPNMPTLETAAVYPGLCLLEGTNVSEGRGTPTPFLIFGAPWIDRDSLTSHLNSLELPGLRFEPVTFTPISIPNKASYPKFKNRLCRGARIVIMDREQILSYRTGIEIVNALHDLYPDSLRFFERHFDRLCGTDVIRQTILADRHLDSLFVTWQKEIQSFTENRKSYLLYE